MHKSPLLRRKNKTTIKDGIVTIRSAQAYLYLLPAFIILAVFLLYPLVMLLRMGFYEKYVFAIDKGTGFGLSAFRYVLRDPQFHTAVKNTCIIVFLGVPITVIIAMVLATLINSLTKAKGVYQCIYFLPYVTSIYAIGIVFKWLFHSDYGYINQFLGLFGIAPLHWLTDSRLVTITVTIFTIWSGMAFKVILFLAGLQKIDRQYYQAARVDGASRFRTFRKVTLPLLSPTIWMVTMMAVLYAFKTYNEIVALFAKDSAGPGNSAITIVFYIYNMFFTKGMVHYAAAASVLFLILVIFVTVVQRVVTRRLTHYV